MKTSIIVEYAKLARIHSAVLTGLAPVLGALAVGVNEPYLLFILFIVGICTHVFGFVFNEYMDIDIDSKSELLKDKPLVKGTISKSAALTYAFSGVVIGYLLLLYLIIDQHISWHFPFLFYTLAWLSIGIYDATSKNIRGSDLALGLWTGSLCLFGGFIAGPQTNHLLFIIAALAILQLFIQNILAGLKDIKQDRSAFGTTTPIRMGVILKKKKIKVPFPFQSYIYTLKFLHLFIFFIPILYLGYKAELLQLILMVFLLILCFLIVAWIFNTSRFTRDKLLRAIGLHEILSYSAVPILLYVIIDPTIVVFLIILPIIWLIVFLKIIYEGYLPDI